MKKAILILALLAFLGCSDDNSTQPGIKDFNGTYLPLHVGNEWQYESVRQDTSYLYLKIIGKKVISNREYYVLVDNIFELDTNYIRTNDGIHYYSYKDNNDLLFRVFRDITIDNDTYNSLRLKTIIETNSTSVIRTKAGDFNNYASVEEGEIERDAGIMFYYAKDIGLVSSFWQIGRINLVYSKINGIETGEKKQ